MEVQVADAVTHGGCRVQHHGNGTVRKPMAKYHTGRNLDLATSGTLEQTQAQAPGMEVTWRSGSRGMHKLPVGSSSEVWTPDVRLN